MNQVLKFVESLNLPAFGSIDEMVNAAERKCLEMDQADAPVYHHFAPGLYVRELNMKAGLFAIGHYQKTEHLNIFLKGAVQMVNDDGTTAILKAPMIFTGKPGRKCGLILEDVVWLNVYPTDETDIETLEATYLDKSEAFNEFKLIPCCLSEDIEDFNLVLKEYGFTPDQVTEQSENQADLIPFPPGSYAVMVSDSGIHGKGLFATADFQPGDYIAPARINGHRTPAGRYTNHAKKPNAIFVNCENSNEVFVMALRPISGQKGGFAGDEITIDYRESLKINGVEKCQV